MGRCMYENIIVKGLHPSSPLVATEYKTTNKGHQTVFGSSILGFYKQAVLAATT